MYNYTQMNMKWKICSFKRICHIYYQTFCRRSIPSCLENDYYAIFELENQVKHFWIFNGLRKTARFRYRVNFANVFLRQIEHTNSNLKRISTMDFVRVTYGHRNNFIFHKRSVNHSCLIWHCKPKILYISMKTNLSS